MPNKKTTPNYRVPALEKGLDVMEVLSTASDPLSLSQICDLTGRSTSELFRTLNCLVERDYVARDFISGKYLLTLKLFELGHRHSPLDHLLKVAERLMETLARKIEDSCHISILRGHEILVMSQVHPPRRVRISISIGSTFPAIRTVSGRLLYSTMADEKIKAILVDCPVYHAMSDKEKQHNWETIREIRKTRVSTAVDESYRGLLDTAILIGNPTIGVAASLAVTQLTATQKDRNQQDVIEALTDCASQINEITGLSIPHKGSLSSNHYGKGGLL